ncbi:MAG: hypothetical protein WCE46_09465 [Methanoregula sp.]|uniref:hypothetical protein n=1 Tax=Methanoregula sp. TaxID=2052170 RepID=UPI003C75C122
MKNFTALSTIAPAIALLFPPASVAAGDTLRDLIVRPEGALPSGQSAIGTFALTSDEPFSDEDTVTMETDLENPAWIYTIEVDGVEQSGSGSLSGSVTIPGNELAYPSAHNITIRAHFTGIAPVVTEEKYLTLVTVCSSHNYPDHVSGRWTIVPREIVPA